VTAPDPWQVITDLAEVLYRGGQDARDVRREALGILDRNGIGFKGMRPARPPSPEPDGTIVIGPQCFASADRRVISWRGINYYPWASDPDHQVRLAPELAAAMRAIAEYERLARESTVPNAATVAAIREGLAS
jgi:hypothetical protein